MARTLIGQLVLRLQDDASGKAKNVEGALRGIERAAKNLDKGGWGAKFQRDLDRFGRSASDIDKVRSSWDRLQRAMSDGKIDKALRTQQIASWKAGVLSNFAQVEARMRSSERQARATGRAFSDMFKIAAAGVGLGTGFYVPGRIFSSGTKAAAARQREKYREDVQGISVLDQLAIKTNAARLSMKYPSIDQTTVMELGVAAYTTMGSMERALPIMEAMTKAFVALQSAKGVDVASDKLMHLIKGIDNLGKNEGPDGVKNAVEIMDAIIKAAQVERGDIDPGKFFNFARQAKTAGPALSMDFLTSVAAAMMQDVGEEKLGNQIAMMFKSFVIGDSSLAGKKYKREQRRIGIRTDDDVVVDPALMSTNPFEWVKKVLIPALERDGIKTAAPGDGASTAEREAYNAAISIAVGKLTGNSSAAALLSRMITQLAQLERNQQMYRNAKGLDAADEAAQKDPFVAWEGFMAKLRDLAAAAGEKILPIITPRLTDLAGVIGRLAEALSAMPQDTGALVTLAGGLVGAYASLKLLSGIVGTIAGMAGVGGAGAAAAGGAGLAITGGASFSIAGPVTITALGTLGLMHANQNAFGVPGGSVSQGGPILGALDSTGSLVDAINKAGDTKPSGRDIIGEWVATLPGKIFEGITGGSRDLRRFLSKDPLAGNLVMPLWDEANDSKLDRLRRNFPYKPGEGYRGKSFADRVAGGEGLDLSGALRRWFWHEGADRPGATMRSGIAAAEEAAAEGLRSLDAYMRRGGDLSDAGAAAGSSFKTALAQEIDEAVRYAEAAGQRIRAALSITATPTVDTSGIQSAVNLAQRVRRLNADFGPAPA